MPGFYVCDTIALVVPQEPRRSASGRYQILRHREWSIFMSNKNKGIFHILLAAFFFSLMSFMVKMSGDLPVMQKAFFRNAIASLMAIMILAGTEEKFKIKKGSVPMLLIRSVCGTIGIVCNFYAIDHMHIADANMLNKLSPFFAIIASIFILKEKAYKKDWLIVLVAFCGALFVMKPSFSMKAVPAVVGAAGGLGAGMAYTFVRRLGKHGERGPVIIMFFSVMSTLFCLPFMILDYHPMNWQQILTLLGAGCAAAGGQLNVTAAYRYAPAKEISVFDYSQVVFAALLGMIFLGEVPDGLSVIGYILIIGAAVYRWADGRK